MGLHHKEAQEHSDHPFRDSVPLEISHCLGVLLAVLEPSDLRLMSVLWFSVAADSALEVKSHHPALCPSPSASPLPPCGTHFPAPLQLWESLADYSWLSAQGRLPVTDTPPLTPLRGGSPPVPGCWMKCYCLFHPLHETPSK